MQKILLIALLSLSLNACKYPDVELCTKFDDAGNCNVLRSPETEGDEWEHVGEERNMVDYDIAISAKDFQKFLRYYQRKCSQVKQ